MAAKKKSGRFTWRDDVWFPKDWRTQGPSFNVGAIQRWSDEQERIAEAERLAKEEAERRKSKDLASAIGEWGTGSAEKFLGGTNRALVNAINLVGSGFNQGEAERRTNEFLRSTGQIDRSGVAPLSRGVRRDTGAFKAGETTGDITKTALDIGLTLAPTGALEKSLRAIPALQKLSKASKLGKVGAGIAAAVPADIVQSIGLAGMDVAAGKDVNLLKDMGISAGLTAAMPVLGVGLGKAKTSFIDNLLSKGNKVARTTKVGNTLLDIKDEVASKLVNNLQFIERPFGNAIDVATGRKVKEVIRELSTNVRQAPGLAYEYRKLNPAWQQLGDLIKGQSDPKKAMKELGEFITRKQDAINAVKLGLGDTTKIPVGSKIQEQAYSLLNKATKADVQRAFDSGLIDEVNYKKWMADDSYTRIQRDMEGVLQAKSQGAGKASVSASVLDQKLKGSERKALDPFASYIDWSNRITTASERNKFASYVIDQLNEKGLATGLRTADDVAERFAKYGEAAQLRPLRNKLEKALKSQKKYIKELELKKTPQVTKKLIEAKQEISKIREQLASASEDVQSLVKRARSLADATSMNKPTVNRLVNGIKETYEVEPRLAQAMRNMDDVTFGALQKYASAPSRLLQAGATGLNPAFAIPNVVRDELNSFILSKNPLSTHNPITFFQGLKESVFKPTVNATARGLRIAQRGEEIWKPSKLYEAYLSKNAQMTYVDLTRNLKSATRQAAEELGIKGESIMRKVESINTATERLGRFQNFYGTYRKMLKEGLTDDEAMRRGMQAARENGIDFSQTGEWAKFAKLFNPYFNASVQGARSLARALKERPVATSLKIGATLLAPVAGATYYNLSDPKRAAIYANKVPDYERDSNFIFVLDNGDYIKIPMPPGVSQFTRPLRNMIESEYLGDRQSFLETARQLIIEPFNPMGRSDFIPQAAKPIVENMSNYSFYRQENIIPGNLQDLPTEEQAYETTSQIYKDLGKIFNMSPLLVQNLIKGYGAGGAEQVVAIANAARTATSLEDAVQKAIQEPRGTIGQIKGRFYGDGSKDRALTTRFYDEKETLDKQRNSVSRKVTKAVQEGDYALARSLIQAFNKSVDEQAKVFQTTYGRYAPDSKLLEILNDIKLSDKTSALQARLK